ncbi:MAG: methyltransferase domain-containing protein, partial [Psychrosphaera sp.]|nr:methyltransferase domain-containing protein [Psychrosphaera sp.]
MSSIETTQQDRTRIKQQFSAASHSYDSAARLQRVTGMKLIESNAELFDGQVLDLGCGTGINTKLIAAVLSCKRSCERSGDTSGVTGCDLAFDMTLKTRAATRGNVDCIQADAEQLPFAQDSFSLVYSNLMLQWIDDLTVPLKEIGRVLKPGGELLFTTLLDGTLFELKNAWAGIDNDNHVNKFSELNEVTQALDNSGFEYHVDVQSIVLDYEEVTQLARELKHL